MINKKREPMQGFTLLETMVAMGILSFLLLGLAAVASISARAAQAGRQRTIATYLATQMLETLCSGNIDDAVLAASFNGDDTRDDSTYDEDDQTALWGQSIRTRLQDSAYGTIGVALIDAAADRITNKYRITVQVTWFNRNRQHQVQVVGVR